MIPLWVVVVVVLPPMLPLEAHILREGCQQQSAEQRNKKRKTKFRLVLAHTPSKQILFGSGNLFDGP